MAKSILITGATGKQGGAVLRALLSSPSAHGPFTIYALTRSSPSSPAAAKLSSLSPNVKVVQGDLEDVEAVFRGVKGGIWGVFGVQTPMGKGGVASEERQGKALVDAALKHGVQHFVYSSVDRGGDVSIETPTDIPHFISKHNIEKYLIEKTAAEGRNGGRKMGWTILRPVAFMDNFTDDFMGRVLPTAWRDVLGNKPLQLVATRDIGKFGAMALLEPEAYDGKAISLAGDELTFKQMSRTFEDKTGKSVPVTYGFLVRIIMWMSKEFGYMVRWFKTDGYGANVAKCKAQLPEMLDFGTYLETESAWKKK
ncbi:NAD(P)-binding protein [Aaosphaeria arxii CBS 175.79]|uniref:NAD(P)-binding protein n=1 Tax=Aaosphaeria arxii CBS 175.79 TaxID=1450172 RepID=A0A6A5X6X1_9PLEO|nr:NAD(P)-binding protein [Aaosphaeria arxii CBS 175.79]KAF2008652.1 NAD(P)-binding protein [Aaosphaeria arxii CBS 175.79]